MTFMIRDKVRVKQFVLDDFFLANLKQEQNEVIKYIIKYKNLLTISKIEYQPMLIIRGIFYFEECYGSLYEDQVVKACTIPIIIANSGDFKNNG